LIIHHLQRKHMFHPRPDSPLHLSNEEPVLGYLKFSAKAPAKSQENKRKQATETTDKPAKAKRIKHSSSRKTRQPRSSPKSVGASEAEEVPAEEPQVADEDADYQKVVEESMKYAYALPKGPLPPSDNEEESEKVVLGAEEGGQDKGQAGPDPDAQAEDQTGSDAGAQAEGQAGSNPDETSKGQARPDPGDAESNVQSISSPVVHAGSDRKHMDLNVADVSPQPSTEQLDEGFTATSRELKKMPPGSPSHQPPPPPLPAGPSGASRAPKASGSAQMPQSPPPSSSTNQESPSKGSAAPSTSKTAASVEYQAWTMMTDIRLRPSISLTPADLEMDEDMAPDEQAQSSNDEDIRNTRSAFVCNNARNASCNAKMNAYDDVNDLFIFDDVCLIKSHVSKMPFRKKPCASLNMHSRSKLNKYLPRIVSKWLPKVQPLAEPIAKWILSHPQTGPGRNTCPEA
nr:hypothetical protein [Tanacetum cinerariifolium]